MKKCLGTILMLILKSTKLLKLLKSAAVLKPLFSLFSVSLFTTVHSFAMGVWVAVAFTVLIFIHEMGHVALLRRYGHPVKWPLFIPFMGAVIFAPPMRSRHKEAWVGYGGPLVGTTAALIAFCIYCLTVSPFWHTVALMGICINLFNMIPLSPLDGGRITQAVSKHFKWVGGTLLFLLTLLLRDPSLMVIWLLFIVEADRFNRSTKAILTTLIYFTICAFFVIKPAGIDPVSIVDIIMGGVLSLACILVAFFRGDREEGPTFESTRLTLGPRKRWNWFLAWIGLILVQVYAIVVLYVCTH